MLNVIVVSIRFILLILGGQKQVALENVALRQQLAVFKRDVRRPKLGIRMLQNPVQSAGSTGWEDHSNSGSRPIAIGTSTLLLDTNEFPDLHKIEYRRRTTTSVLQWTCSLSFL